MQGRTLTPFLDFPPSDFVIPEPECHQAGGNPGPLHAAPGEKGDFPWDLIAQFHGKKVLYPWNVFEFWNYRSM